MVVIVLPQGEWEQERKIKEEYYIKNSVNIY